MYRAKRPKVSVIIPVYNASEHLRECMDSIVNQTLKEIEIICVDDGSTDDSSKILREYAAKDDRIKLLRQENLFAGAARNVGMKAASGEYCAFLDADDFFYLDGIEKLYALAEKNGLDFVKTRSMLFDDERQEFAENHYFFLKHITEEKLHKLYSPKEHADLLCSVPDVPWNGLYRTEFLKENNIEFNGLRCCNDHSFFINCICSASRVMLADVVLACYRVSQKDSLVSVRSRYFDCQIESHELSRKIILKSDISFKQKQALLKEELNAVFYWFNRLKRDSVHLDKNRKIMGDFVAEYDVSYVGMHYLRNFPFSEDFWEFYFQDADGGRAEISIIIPARNEEKYIGDCLKSVLQQTLKEIEIILVDDNSSDDTYKIMQDYARRDERIRVIHKGKNAGTFEARKSGVLKASGRYLMFVDADDLLVPEACRKALELIKKHQTDVVQFTAEVRNYTGSSRRIDWLKYNSRPAGGYFEGREILRALFVKRTHTTVPWGKIYLTNLCKSAAKQMPEITCRIGEDILQLFYITFFADTYIAEKTEPLYCYRYGLGISNEDAMSLTKFAQYCDMVNFFESVQSFLSARSEPFEEYRDICEGISMRTCEDVCREYMSRVHEEDRLAGLYLFCRSWRDNPVFEEVTTRTLEVGLVGKGMDEEIEKIDFLLACAEKSQEFPKEAAERLLQDEKVFPCLNLSAEKIFRKSGKRPQVSVIIPVYNTGKYVAECVRSVTGQSLKNVEIICVDDGSTDGSLKVLNDLAKEDDRIKVISLRHNGVSCARNAGAGEAAGEYIYFLDSDDYILEHTLEKIYDMCDKHSLDIIYFDADVFASDEDKKNYPQISEQLSPAHSRYYQRKKSYSEIVSGGELFVKMIKDDAYCVSPGLQFINRRFYMLNKLRFEEGVIHEDNLFSMQAILLAKRVSHVARRFYMRRWRPDSIMTKPLSSKNLIGYLTCVMKLIQFVLQNPLADDVFAAVVFKVKILGSWGIENAYNNLSEAEQAEFLSLLTPVETLAFCMIVSDTGIPAGMPQPAGKGKIRSAGVMTRFRDNFERTVRCYKIHGFYHTVIKIIDHLRKSS